MQAAVERRSVHAGEEDKENMGGIRVLVVDDSVVIRKVLTEALATDSEIEVVASAADGSIALSKIPLVKPDLITLDVEIGDVRAGDAGGDSQTVSEAAGDHVQYVDRAGGGDDVGGSVAGSERLRHETAEQRERGRDPGANPVRAGPQGERAMPAKLRSAEQAGAGRGIEETVAATTSLLYCSPSSLCCIRRRQWISAKWGAWPWPSKWPFRNLGSSILQIPRSP